MSTLPTITLASLACNPRAAAKAKSLTTPATKVRLEAPAAAHANNLDTVTATVHKTATVPLSIRLAVGKSLAGQLAAIALLPHTGTKGTHASTQAAAAGIAGNIAKIGGLDVAGDLIREWQASVLAADSDKYSPAIRAMAVTMVAAEQALAGLAQVDAQALAEQAESDEATAEQVEAEKLAKRKAAGTRLIEAAAAKRIAKRVAEKVATLAA
jgi:hypothetical protein